MRSPTTRQNKLFKSFKLSTDFVGFLSKECKIPSPSFRTNGEKLSLNDEKNSRFNRFPRKRTHFLAKEGTIVNRILPEVSKSECGFSRLVVSHDESNWIERAEQMVLDTRRTFLVDENKVLDVREQSTKRHPFRQMRSVCHSFWTSDFR